MTTAKPCPYRVEILGQPYAACVLPAGHSEEWRNLPNVALKEGHRLRDVNGYNVSAPYWCGHCGRPCGDFAGGYATVGIDYLKSVRVCHPNTPDRPDCYTLITRYNEVVGVRLGETQTGYAETTTGRLPRALVQ